MVLKHRAKLRVVSKVRRAGVLAYLRAVQGSRYALIAALSAFLILQCMVMAAFGALITGFMLWDEDPTFKLQILFGIFTAMFALPALALLYILSERKWYKLSGAEKLVEEFQRENEKKAA